MKIKKITWVIASIFAVSIGLYPAVYFLRDMSEGLLNSKPESLIDGNYYLLLFYLHISLGGLALLVGWTQFFKKFRNRKPKWHRIIGKIYIISVLISGFSGLFIAYHATGGIVAMLGFGTLALLWLFTTSMAYVSVKNGQISDHQKWMIRSYALCFAAVTLRLYIPLFTILLEMEFIKAYVLISWVCWVPNLLFAEFLIRSKQISLDPR